MTNLPSEFSIGDKVAKLWDSKCVGTVTDVMINRRRDGREAYLYKVDFEGTVGVYVPCDLILRGD